MKRYLLLTLMVSAFCSTNSQAQQVAETHHQAKATALAEQAEAGDFTPSASFCASTNIAVQREAVQNCIINGGGQQDTCAQNVTNQCEKLGFSIDPSTLL